MKQFKNRSEAGQLLAAKLQAYKNNPDVLVLALPRGGVPVAFEIAQSLEAALDVFLVRKLGVPGHEELGMGAISSGGDRVLNKEIIDALQLSESTVEKVTQREQQELTRREATYRRNRPPLQIQGKTVILVDDGLATGSTMLAAIRAVQKLKAAKIVIAVPVAPVSTFESMEKLGDAMICLMTPEPFYGVGLWYEDFTQTTDEEVINLLEKAESWGKIPESHSYSRDDHLPGFHQVSIPAGSVELAGKLLLPEGENKGIVMLVQGTGYPGQSPQHDLIAHKLYEAGFTTLRFDLLTREEEASELKSRHLRFDTPLLTRRLIQATDWVMHELATYDQPLGFFGSSTGTGAVLKAAATIGRPIKAIVSLSGRPDLAGESLSKVTAPTLLLMGGQDISIMDLNVCARSRMRPGLVRIEVVPQASHLFEEEGALERAANLSTRWFERHLAVQEIGEASHFSHGLRFGDRGRNNEYGLFA
ncbi:MAG TPA: phosphoribosyltransferase family protein [Oligoflexus sp.]|uniref:phosphoribosyltransferase family protein n=1 Tax=Oligoflexus sp. TaxID=1971216 RepID=UPI002D7F0015|nr:phosphoribosyltransferase family protein [Oligoflexus sp.]HET9241221.1 phosphoribosyltransferase family protein [Oligoflexus sp.]